jgi:F0F1-type ATP synthase assembly protein I
MVKDDNPEAIENIGLEWLRRRLVNFFTNRVILTGGTGERGRRTVSVVVRASTGLTFADGVDMAKNARRFPFANSVKVLQDNVVRSGPAAGASYTLVGALLLFGAVGYALDQWRGTSPWFLVGGLVLGMVVGFYELVKTTWQR